MSLSQIAARTGLARSTVHRLVGALEGEHRGAGLPEWSLPARAGDLRAGGGCRDGTSSSNSIPSWPSCSRDVKETVDLAVLEHDHVRFVHQIAAIQRLRAVSSVGAVFPAHSTANGKALLAELSDE